MISRVIVVEALIFAQLTAVHTSRFQKASRKVDQWCITSRVISRWLESVRAVSMCACILFSWRNNGSRSSLTCILFSWRKNGSRSSVTCLDCSEIERKWPNEPYTFMSIVFVQSKKLLKTHMHSGVSQLVLVFPKWENRRHYSYGDMNTIYLY